MDYEGFGKTGAVSMWRKGRDPMGKPIYQKVQVTLAHIFFESIDLKHAITFKYIVPLI